MTQPVKAPNPARLDELAAVTKEYATYSRSRFGVAEAVVGAALIAGAGLRAAGWYTASEYVFLLAPLAFLAAFARARAHYQRHGEVTEREDGLSLFRSAALVGIYASSVFWIWLRTAKFQGLTADGAQLIAIAALVAVPVLAQKVTRGAADAAKAFITAAVFADWADPSRIREPLGWRDGALAVVGMVLVAIGVGQHLRYRRLERRLAALKGVAP